MSSAAGSSCRPARAHRLSPAGGFWRWRELSLTTFRSPARPRSRNRWGPPRNNSADLEFLLDRVPDPLDRLAGGVQELQAHRVLAGRKRRRPMLPPDRSPGEDFRGRSSVEGIAQVDAALRDPGARDEKV